MALSSPRNFIVFLATGILPLTCTPGWGFDPVLPEANIPDLSSYLAQTTIDAFIKTIGISLDHRPYEPASSLGTSFDFGIETTLVAPPDELGSSISSIGSSAASTDDSPIPFIPSLKIHLRKGLGDKFEAGISTLYVPPTLPYAGGTLFFGGDLKYVFYTPEEGITAAFRASYNFINLALQYTNYTLTAKTVTLTPQFIVSTRVAYAQPYLGTGYQFTYGSISATVPSPPIALLPGVSIAPISLNVEGSGSGIFFFGGLSLLTAIRFRLTLEGTFNPGGEHSIGTKIGFTL